MLLERCQSGWMGQSWKLLYPKGYREFESRPLRKKIKYIFMINFLKRLKKSFYYAWSGIKTCFGVEENLTIMVVISLIVIIGGIYFKISHTEWLVSIIMIIAVLSLELFNTSMEQLLDLFHPEINEKVKTIKDMLAGGISIVSIGAGIIGFIIFLPKIINLF